MSDARRVIADVDVPWDNGVSHVPRGTIVLAPAGSSVEAAYGGPSNLEDAGALPGDGSTISGMSN